MQQVSHGVIVKYCAPGLIKIRHSFPALRAKLFLVWPREVPGTSFAKRRGVKTKTVAADITENFRIAREFLLA